MADDPNIFSEIFNERGAVMTFFGALGGMVRSAALQTTWRETLRVTFIGAATAFGVGVLGPEVLRPWIGDISNNSAAQGTVSATAFLVGLMAVTIVERFVDKSKEEDDVASSENDTG